MFTAVLLALSLVLHPEDLAVEERLCDDGVSSPWEEDGSPNYRCVRDGCAATEDVCYFGLGCADSETCQTSVCKGWFDCHIMWWMCDGKLECVANSDPKECVCEESDIEQDPADLSTEVPLMCESRGYASQEFFTEND